MASPYGPGSQAPPDAAGASSPSVLIPDAEIANPVQWYFQRDQEAEWWHRGGATKEDAIGKGRAEYDGTEFWIAQCKSMVPSFALFDAEDLFDRLNEDDCWWEDGWTGEPGPDAARELERRLEATFRQWFAEFATLDGGALDELRVEKIPAIATEAGTAETGTGSVNEGADPEVIAP